MEVKCKSESILTYARKCRERKKTLKRVLRSVLRMPYYLQPGSKFRPSLQQILIEYVYQGLSSTQNFDENRVCINHSTVLSACIPQGEKNPKVLNS